MDIKETWICSKAIAHRGLHNSTFPENSFGAFQNAISNSYAIELDVRLLDDGEIVVFHDESLKRMTDADGYVSALKTEDLKTLRLSKTEYRIPILKDVLELVDGKTPILIEIKNDNCVGALELKLKDMLENYKGEVAIQAFNPRCLEYFAQKAPQYMRGILACNYTKEDVSSAFKRYLLKRFKFNNSAKPDFVSYRCSDLPNKYVTKTQLPVLAWTVRSQAEQIKLSSLCDNIIFEKFLPEPDGGNKA